MGVNLREGEPGFVITNKGWEVIGNCIADNRKLNITGIAFGDGVATGYIGALESLVNPIADGSSTDAVVYRKEEDGVTRQTDICFVAEYRSDYRGQGTAPITGVWPADITYDWYIKEFGIWAEDPVTGGNVMIYYATLGNYPHPVNSYHATDTHGDTIDIRRYPITISISDDAEVKITYTPEAFVTYAQMEEYHKEICVPEVTEIIDNHISEHNVSPEAHPDIRQKLDNHRQRIEAIEDFINGHDSVTISYEFSELVGFELESGCHNAANAILEV